MESKTLVNTKLVWVFDSKGYVCVPAMELGSTLLLLKDGVACRRVKMGREAFETREEIEKYYSLVWSVSYTSYGYLLPYEARFGDGDGYINSREGALRYCIQKNESQLDMHREQVRMGEGVIAEQKKLLEQLTKESTG